MGDQVNKTVKYLIVGGAVLAVGALLLDTRGCRAERRIEASKATMVEARKEAAKAEAEGRQVAVVIQKRSAEVAVPAATRILVAQESLASLPPAVRQDVLKLAEASLAQAQDFAAYRAAQDAAALAHKDEAMAADTTIREVEKEAGRAKLTIGRALVLMGTGAAIVLVVVLLL